jgi:hypothetical protein
LGVGKLNGFDWREEVRRRKRTHFGFREELIFCKIDVPDRGIVPCRYQVFRSVSYELD